MDNIKIAATERSPEIDFNFTDNLFAIKGESYPEDVSEFFGDIMGQLYEHLANQENAEITFDIALIYFNSSSAKIFMGLFDTLEKVAEEDNKVVINWRYEADDDNMEELGEEFAEDMEMAEFNLLPE